MSELRDVVIIGSGPAGLTAAIYAARANLTPLVFEGLQPGGQLTITTEVENFPGFAHPIEGPELMDAMREQAVRVGTEVRINTIESVDLSQRPFTVKADDGTTVLAKTLIICTGASAKWIGIESEVALQNRGVSACATCDGFFFRGKDVIVVGGGDTAMEEAMYLTRMCNSVTVIHRRDTLRASKVMADRALANPKIRFEWNSAVKEIKDVTLGKVTGVVLESTIDGSTKDLACDGVFVAIGHIPRSELLISQIDLDNEGYVKVEGRSTRTNLAGVFACGDLVDHTYRQAITAAGSGCQAALDAEKFLSH